MKSLFTLSILALSTTFAFAQGQGQGNDNGHNQPCDRAGKVLVCHIPPGNPENVQEICISERAVAAHLAHGCYVGFCDNGSTTRLDQSHAEHAIADFVSVYPNPFSNQLSIEMVFEEETKAEIAIFDTKGTLIAVPFKGMSESSFIMDYNTDHLATGLYIVRVVTPTKTRSFKLSKNL